MRVPYQRLLSLLILEWEEIRPILIDKLLNNDVNFFNDLFYNSFYEFKGIVFPDTSKNLDIRSNVISARGDYCFLSKDYFVFESINFSLVDRDGLVEIVITHNFKTNSRTNLSEDIDENYEILSENFYDNDDIKEFKKINSIVECFYLFCEKVKKL